MHRTVMMTSMSIEEGTKHAGTASLLPPATGPPCLLDPCSSLHLHLDRLHPLPPLLSALCTRPSFSAGGEGLFTSGEGSSIRGLASCPLVSGEGLNLYAHCAEMSKVVIHRLPFPVMIPSLQPLFCLLPPIMCPSSLDSSLFSLHHYSDSGRASPHTLIVHSMDCCYPSVSLNPCATVC